MQELSSSNKTSATAADAYADIAADAELNPPLVGGGWGTATDREDLEGWGASTDGWEGVQATIGDDDSPNPVMSEHLPSVIEVLPMWDVKPPTLLPLLGPTMLPLAHTMGMVEQSTRRIMHVDSPHIPHLLTQNMLAVKAVEEDLTCHARKADGRVYGGDRSWRYLGGDCAQSQDRDGQCFPSLLPSVPPR
ncbi:hypothetical protein EDB83DRAFT_2527340 [Lactarius deliciosus]|nr:hypothetical protein EDB83DRAFT_2527340 [Lactarius deliciosus]